MMMPQEPQIFASDSHPQILPTTRSLHMVKSFATCETTRDPLPLSSQEACDDFCF